MTSLFVRMSRVAGFMVRRSFPAMSGAASRHQRLKWAWYSVSVMPPFPTSSMSGSFQWPGPEKASRPAWRSRIWTTPIPPPFLTFQISSMSPVVRHRLPMSFAQSQGLVSPHSQMLKTMGRPLASRASRIRE